MITTVCPACGVECDHQILREGAELVVQCSECGRIHRVTRPPEPRILTIRAIVSRETESKVCSVEAFDDEVVALGDHIVAECEDEVIGVEITGIEDMTDFGLKKRLTSAFRRLIGNGQANLLVMTANHRAWRHVIEMRTSVHAEEEIRVIMSDVAQQLKD